METLTTEWRCGACDEIHSHIEPNTREGKIETLTLVTAIIMHDIDDFRVYKDTADGRRDETAAILVALVVNAVM